MLIEKGLVMCRELRENPEVLKEVGLDPLRIREIHEEVNAVCGSK
jgi:hypothetical protein